MRFALLATLLLAIPVQASEWVAVTTTANGDAHSYDSNKLHVAEGTVTYWRKVEFRMPLPVRSALAQAGLYRERIDCRQRTLRTLGYLYYAADGSVIENVYSPDAPAVQIVDGTPVGQLEDMLCPLASAPKAGADAGAGTGEDELRKLRQEVEALQSQVRRLKQGIEVPGQAASDAAR